MLLTTPPWLSSSLRSLERPVKHTLGRKLRMELLWELQNCVGIGRKHILLDTQGSLKPIFSQTP